jgi:hypothetical protein
MAELIHLRAPVGTDEANFGTVRFPVLDDGTISVPEAAAGPLEKVGGFTVTAEKAAPALSVGMIKMRGGPGVGITWQGQSFTSDDTGLILVPIEAVADLVPHGFRVAEGE